MKLQSLINVLVPMSLIAMMLAIGMDVAIEKVLAVARDWRLLIRATVANYVLVPLVTVGLLLAFHANPMVSVGFLILAACPGAPFGPVFTAIGRGNVPAAVGLMILLAASSAILAPLILHVLIPLLAGDLHAKIDTLTMLVTLLVTQLVPLCVGLSVRHSFPSVVSRMLKPANIASAALGLTAIFLILAGQYRTLLVIQPRGLFGMLALLTASLAIGWLLGGQSQQDRRAMALTTSLRNVGVGLVIANSSFVGTPVVTAVVAYALVELLGSFAAAFLPLFTGRARGSTAAVPPKIRLGHHPEGATR